MRPESELVQDLAGNVWEWTASEYTEDYCGAHSSVLNANISNDSPRVLRGGSWLNGPLRLRSAERGWLDSRSRYDDLGFRVAMTL